MSYYIFLIIKEKYTFRKYQLKEKLFSQINIQVHLMQ